MVTVLPAILAVIAIVWWFACPHAYAWYLGKRPARLLADQWAGVTLAIAQSMQSINIALALTPSTASTYRGRHRLGSIYIDPTRECWVSTPGD